MLKLFASLYLFLTAASAIGVFILGAAVAPIIFHSETVAGVKLLARYDAGLLMSEIFARFNYVLLVTAALIVAFEGFLSVNKKNTKIMVFFSSANLIEILLYVFYFTPKILSFQAPGEAATKTEEFATIHKMAELDFKFLLFTLIMSFFIRCSTLLSDKLATELK